MALRGNLKELSLPDIFQLVTFSGKTGVLRIRRGDDAQGSVWFRDGDVFFAQSNWHTDPLGERLVRAQRITPMALDRALELRAAEPADGKRLGEILVEQGYITDKVLEAFVQEQMQDTIFDLMRWDEGDFEFEAMPEAPEEDIGLAVSIENVIMEGSRRLEEWNRIKKKIPSTDVVFKMATAPGEGTFEISLKPMEWNLLLLVDGSRSVAELARATNRTDFEVARVVYGLFSAGLLEFATEDEVKKALADRTQREEKFAQFEEEQAATRAAEEAAKPQPEVAPDLVATTSWVPPGTTSQPEVASEPAEVPEFLGGENQAATPDDIAALEAAMGALLSAPAAQQTAEAPPAAPYTPGEEPAFIAASQESEGAAGAMAVPSVEDLLGDIADLSEPEIVAEAPVSEAVAPAAEEAAVATEPLAAEAEPAATVEPEAADEVEAAPASVAQNVAPEPGPLMPEPTPVESFEFIPVTAPPAQPAEPQPVPEAPVAAPLEPGSFVVVPAMAPEQPPAPAEPEVPADWEPPQISFDDDNEGLAEPASAAALEELPAAVHTEPDASTEPAPESPAHVPEVVAETPRATEEPGRSAAVPGLQGFEHDLMALGLGELPPELREPGPEDLEPVVEPMGVSAAEETPAVVSESVFTTPDSESVQEVELQASESDDSVDFSALLQSLDISADDAEAAVPPEVDVGPDPSFGSDPLLDLEAPTPSAGVISTDAFLDDLSIEGDFGFTDGLTDELSALTGADRPVRPSASVHKIVDKSEATLHRDSRVDRETLLKIINGIENL